MKVLSPGRVRLPFYHGEGIGARVEDSWQRLLLTVRFFLCYNDHGYYHHQYGGSTRVVKRNDKKKYARRYPWDEWLAMPSFTLRKGRDFNGRAYTMAQQIRNRLYKTGEAKVSIEISDDDKQLVVTVLSRKG